MTVFMPSDWHAPWTVTQTMSVSFQPWPVITSKIPAILNLVTLEMFKAKEVLDFSLNNRLRHLPPEWLLRTWA